jgi:hypothetical protein
VAYLCGISTLTDVFFSKFWTSSRSESSSTCLAFRVSSCFIFILQQETKERFERTSKNRTRTPLRFVHFVHFVDLNHIRIMPGACTSFTWFEFRHSLLEERDWNNWPPFSHMVHSISYLLFL